VSEELLEIDITHSLHTASGILPMEVAISFPIGSILAVTGPSGSGKTTLLRQIAGLTKPDTGYIGLKESEWLNTESRVNIPVQNRSIGFVFQDYALFPHLTVEENLLFALPKGGDTGIIHELLFAVGLKELANRKPFQLSGGQQQRVALARALVRKPDVLLLDEPLSALDTSMRENLQELLLKFHQKFGFTMIIVTHDLSEIFRLADHVAILKEGKLDSFGTPADVYIQEQHNNKDLVLHGEVLSRTSLQEVVRIHALINYKMHIFDLSEQEAEHLHPGRHFTVSYHPDHRTICPISN
jgi:molybdate transport system ATP-binding protein